MGIKIIEQPTAELISLEECRAQCNIQPYTIDSDGVGTHPDDGLLMDKQRAAREHCENFLGMSLAEKTYELALDEFPGGAILLPIGPVTEIISVIVTDADQAGTTMAPTGYLLDNHQPMAWLLPASGTSWPAAGAFANAVKIRYVAGYPADSDGEALPWAIRAAILLMMNHLYEHRSDATEKALTNIPNGVEALLRPLRVRLGCA